jgi:hypothetical protein
VGGLEEEIEAGVGDGGGDEDTHGEIVGGAGGVHHTVLPGRFAMHVGGRSHAKVIPAVGPFMAPAPPLAFPEPSPTSSPTSPTTPLNAW